MKMGKAAERTRSIYIYMTLTYIATSALIAASISAGHDVHNFTIVARCTFQVHQTYKRTCVLAVKNIE